MKERMSQTKVAVVVFEDIFRADGTTVRVHRVLELLNKKLNVTVIACSDKNRNKLVGMDSVHVRSLGTGPLIYRTIPLPVELIPILLWNLKLALVLLRNRFDVVYCANDWLGFLSVYLVSKIRRYKLIFEAHGIMSKSYQERGHSGILLRLDRSLEKFAVKHSDFVLALSSNTFKFYQAYNTKIDCVTVFVDEALFKANNRKRIVDGKLIGLIGPFDNEVRGRHQLDFLYSRIDNFDSRIGFILIGRCDKTIRHDRIIHTGYLDSMHDYIEHLCRLDAVLVPEGISTTGPLNKIIEPMSCSLPVFATPKAMPGLYFVEPGRDLFVFEENELVDKINSLIFDSKLMAEIGRNARNVVEQYYSKKANEVKLLRIMELVTRGQHASHLR